MKPVICKPAVVALAIACCVSVLAQGTGSISGTLLGLDGNPLPGAMVRATIQGGMFLRSAQTDEKGAYHIVDVPPGNYFIADCPFSCSTYYPGRPSIDGATAVTVRAGADVVGIDFKLVTPVGVSVSGRVIAPPGVVNPVSVALRTVRVPPQVFNAAVNPDGTFKFTNIPPDTYNAIISSFGLRMDTQTVTVGTQNITNLSFAVPAHFDLAVHFTATGGDPLPPNINRVQLAAALGSATHLSAPHPDGASHMDIPLGEFKISVQGLPMDYSAQSIRYGSIDLLTTSLTISAAPTDDIQVELERFPSKNGNAAKVQGKVTNLPPESYRYHPKIHLDRVTPSGGGALEAEVHNDGSFEFPRVPPGSYTLTTSGLASAVKSSITVADSDIPNLVVLLAGLTNPFPEYPGGSFAGGFENNQVTLKGVLTQEITQIRPPAPVMYFRMEVIDDKTGKPQNWDVLVPNAGVRTLGEIPDVSKLKAGTHITIQANTSRDGANRVSLVRSAGANTTIGINVD